MNGLSEKDGRRVNEYDVVVVGGGQAGLSIGYFLHRRTDLRFVILDSQKRAGGAWLHGWNSLRLFSPAQWSSISGWMFPGPPARYPTRDEVIDYLTQYERRYDLPVERPANVSAVRREGEYLTVESSAGVFQAGAVVSATGTWKNPHIPDYPGIKDFHGAQVHSADYRSPEEFAGQDVLVVGAGNSGAQVMAEVSLVSNAMWVTLEEPQFLPDDVDGRVLFDRASEKYRALVGGACGAGGDDNEKPSDPLGNIVMVKPVLEARKRGTLEAVRPFVRFTTNGVVWTDGSETAVDAVIWCTGFKSALEHLAPLGVISEAGRIDTAGTRSLKEPRLWLVGYGDWTGYASATLIGVGRTARRTVEEITASLKS
jgi:putative flavoprotein involved in K+ transport